MKLLAYLFSLFLVSVHSDKESDAMMRRCCQLFAPGIHANRDPLDEAASRGAPAVFEFAYTKKHSDAADQFEPVNSVNLGECNNGNSFKGIIVSLGSPLGVSKMDIFSSLPHGFTYSNEYKYERDQMRKGGMALYKAYCRMGFFRLVLHDHTRKLSPAFQADLEVANKMASNQSGAQFIVGKYGSQYLAEAIMGGSLIQTDFIPNAVFKVMARPKNELSIRPFFWGFEDGFPEEAAKFKASLARESPHYHRRTSLSARGGGFPPKSLSEPQLQNWVAQAQKYPAILYSRLVPLSELISHPSLKKQVAQIAFTQILRGLALNVLDTEFFTQKIRSAMKGAKFTFPGLVEYAHQTEQQMVDFTSGVESEFLANGRLSPFIKMDAIAKALDFIKVTKGKDKDSIDLWGLDAVQRNATRETLTKCIQGKYSIFGETEKKAIEDAFKAASPYVDYFQELSGSFQSWHSTNEHLKAFVVYEKKRDYLQMAKGHLDVLFRPQFNLRAFIANCRGEN